MVVVRQKSDADIQQAVLQELKWDSRVEDTEVGVEVRQGTVTLTGIVSSYGKKLVAADAAHRVPGVLDVANDIIVRIPGVGRTDTDIARAVRHTLEWDVRVPDRKIQTTVTEGWVSLAGTVENWAQRQDAERVVRELAGVRGVNNHIEVRPHPQVSTEALREAIEAALERHAERMARHITVSADDEGTVILRGKVDSWDEREAILGTVGHAPGVRSVRDELVYG